MPILPLPQFEADLEADRKTYEALKPPKTIVVRFGSMKLVGEFPYDGDAKPGCGSKLVEKKPAAVASAASRPSSVAGSQKAPAARATPSMKDRHGRELPADVVRMLTEMNRTDGSKQ